MRAPWSSRLLDAERHRHARHRAVEIDADWIRGARTVLENDILEQERGSAAGHLHHSIRDLAQLEVRFHRRLDANEFAGGVDGFYEFS